MIELSIITPPSFPSTGNLGGDWNYSQTALPQQELLNVPSENPAIFKKPKLRTGFFQENHYELDGNTRPYLPPSITKMLEKGATRPLTSKQAVKLMKEIAEITIDFYNIHEGKFLAIGFDGRIVDSANSSFDLLMKMQGRKIPIQTFVWHVGSDAFSGWDT